MVPAWFVAFVATWKIGAVPQPVSYRLPLSELERITELAGSKAVIGGPREAIAEFEHALMSERGRVKGRRCGVSRCCCPISTTASRSPVRRRRQTCRCALRSAGCSATGLEVLVGWGPQSVYIGGQAH